MTPSNNARKMSQNRVRFLKVSLRGPSVWVMEESTEVSMVACEARVPVVAKV